MNRLPGRPISAKASLRSGAHARPGVHARPGRHDRARGVALVEFSLVLIPFLYLLMGMVDLGRGIYVNNAVAQAAREIARVTSVHPCTGSPCTTYGPETQAVIDTQKRLIPGLVDSGIVVDCTDVANNPVTVTAGNSCPAGQFIRVTVTVPFQVVTPFIPTPKNFSFSSVSHVQVP